MKKKLEKGFTLVEMIIYMGLLALLIIVFTDIFTAVIDTQIGTQATSQVAQDGRYIYTRIIYDINRADSISIPQNLGDISNTLQLTINGIQYTYAVSGTDLTLSTVNGSGVLNGYDTSVSGLQFHRIGNVNGKHTFQINFTITGKSHLHGPVETKQFQTTAGLR